MKKTINTLLLLLLLIGVFTTCGDKDKPSNIFSVAFEGSDQELSYLPKEYFLQITTAGTWEIKKNDPADWYSFSHIAGQGASTVIITVNRNEGDRRASSFEVISGNNKESINVIQQKFDIEALLHPNQESYGIEIPKLSDNIIENRSQFVVHYAKNLNGKDLLNYCMEYNYDRRHSRWVAFVFDDETSFDAHVGRTDEWAGDPSIPVQYWTYASDYANIGGVRVDRGHLIASADRQYSWTANAQTFYYSNMSPQLNNFNVGIWADLESKVRSWGMASPVSDIMYVVKGGTIDEGNYRPYHNTSQPLYYFMALLSKKNNNYNAIAFYFEHKPYFKENGSYYLENYTLTIDELEQKTGIDFFHNLPDDIEESVESVKDNLKWPGLN